MKGKSTGCNKGWSNPWPCDGDTLLVVFELCHNDIIHNLKANQHSFDFHQLSHYLQPALNNDPVSFYSLLAPSLVMSLRVHKETFHTWHKSQHSPSTQPFITWCTAKTCIWSVNLTFISRTQSPHLGHPPAYLLLVLLPEYQHPFGAASKLLYCLLSSFSSPESFSTCE